jgi:YHS domain-containing protein
MARLIDVVFDLILVIVVVRMLWSALRGLFGSAATRSSPTDRASRPQGERETVRGETARDPVCGMFVSTELSHRLEWHGKLLHFCSEECLNQYRKSASA